MRKLCAAAGMALQESYSMHSDTEAGDSAIAFRIPYESPDKYPDASPDASPSPHVMVYYLPSFTVADIKIREVILKFYDGVLAEIKSQSPGELPEMFEIKHGKPNVTTLVTPRTCLYRLTGNKVTYKDESFFGRWYNGDIEALSFLGKFRDSNCKEELVQSFSVTSTSKAKLIEASEKVALLAEKAKTRNELKRKLSDL